MGGPEAATLAQVCGQAAAAVAVAVAQRRLSTVPRRLRPTQWEERVAGAETRFTSAAAAAAQEVTVLPPLARSS